MCVAHGLPEDNDLADEVLSVSDYISAEPWNMRLGTSVWAYFKAAAKDAPAETLPYILMKVSKLTTDKFNALMQLIFHKSPKAIHILHRVSERAEDRLERDDFDKKMDTLSNSFVVINDDEKLLN